MNIAKTLIASAVVAVPLSFGVECKVRDAGGRSACAPPKAEASGTVAAKEATIETGALAVLIRSGVKLTLLDARSAKYDDGRRIPGARSLTASADEATITTRAGGKSDLIVTYCSNLKCPASKALAGKLRSLGYTNVVEYPAGIAGWIAAGNEVVNKKG